MDQRTLELIGIARLVNPEIDELVKEHQELDHKVDQFSERTHLTPEEHLELARLKKEKLRLRDKIEQLIHRKASA